jgi:hypothetical protein
MKTLEDISNEIAHLQRRVDYLQSCFNAILPIALTAVTRIPSKQSGADFKTEFTALMDLYVKHCDRAFARSSEFPFETGDIDDMQI